MRGSVSFLISIRHFFTFVEAIYSVELLIKPNRIKKNVKFMRHRAMTNACKFSSKKVIFSAVDIRLDCVG